MLNSKNVNTNQKGFTLIELVVVIVILGILAVTAAPKFINLQDDAKTATIDGVLGAINSATALVHSKSLIAGNTQLASGTTVGNLTSTVVVDAAGTTVNINFGYPTDVAGDGEWGDLLDLNDDDFTVVQGNDGTDNVLIIHRANDVAPVITAALDGDTAATTTANCFAWYYTPSEVNAEPTSGSVDCQVE